MDAVPSVRRRTQRDRPIRHSTARCLSTFAIDAQPRRYAAAQTLAAGLANVPALIRTGSAIADRLSAESGNDMDQTQAGQGSAAHSATDLPLSMMPASDGR